MATAGLNPSSRARIAEAAASTLRGGSAAAAEDGSAAKVGSPLPPPPKQPLPPSAAAAPLPRRTGRLRRLDWRAKEGWLNRLRLASGLVLFAYVTTHLTNHALGLVSLAAMEAGREVFLALWRNWLGTLLLYGAFVTHIALGLWSLLRRRTWRGVSWTEVAQALLGLTVPPLLIVHIAATRLAHEYFGLFDNYAYELVNLWVLAPLSGLKQVTVTIIVWLHGCLGVYFWLRLKPWYRNVQAAAYSFALLLPVLGLLGFVAGGREVERLLQNPAWAEAFRAGLNLSVSVQEAASWIHATEARFIWGYFALLALLLIARLGREGLHRARFTVTLTYPDGRSVAIRPGSMSVLEASRSAGIPHASVCGGRGRCSTCRVRLGDGAERMPEPSEEEIRVLKRVGAPPGVRLACQLRPAFDLTVTPLLPPGATPAAAFARPNYLQGDEREIAILFADLRNFTRLSERRLPYDIVFVLNQYFRAMGQAVEGNGGRLDKFIGDGVMALFGIDRGPEIGCRNALAAARAMSEAIAKLNETLAHDLGETLKIGIGIHCGHAIVGEMGYGRVVGVTAIGDAVNTASRLEAATKEFGAELVASQIVAERAGVDLSAYRHEQVALRGREASITVRVIAQASALAPEIKASPREAP